MPLSDAYEKKLLDHLFGKATLTAPTIYLAASTADPGDDGASIAEPVANGYTRVATTAADWNAASVEGLTTNAADLSFPVATGSWGTISFLAMFDGPTAGTFIGSGGLAVNKTIAAGQILRFTAGNISIQMG